MGLDLTLELRKENGTWENDIEVAYGRKTWAIAETLRDMGDAMDDDDYAYKIPLEKWNEFISRIEPHVTKLGRLVDQFDEEHYDCAMQKVQDDIENILDKIFYDYDDSYYLGADWEARALLRWYDANTEIQKYMNSGKYDLILKRNY